MSDLELFEEAEDLTDCPTVVIHPDGSREYLNMTAEAITEELIELTMPHGTVGDILGNTFLYEKVFHGPTGRGGYDRGPVTFMRDDQVPEASVDEAARLLRESERTFRTPMGRLLFGDVGDIFGNGL